MLLKYFYDDKIAHASYMVGCQATGEAIVIDPGRDLAPYLDVAEEQEMTANGEESRAKLVEAEAEVPKAMAAAFASGSLSVMDYYRLKNVDADTKMRASIADVGERGQTTAAYQTAN